MSHKLTDKLIDDNKQYYEELKQKKYIPKKLFRLFSFKVNYIFAGSFFKLKKYMPCLWFSTLAFYYSPLSFIKQFKVYRSKLKFGSGATRLGLFATFQPVR